MATIERRRNMRAECCRACGSPCQAGQGYLYKDTHTHRRNRHSGRFAWYVKCAECHGGSKTRAMVTREKQAAARADEPMPRPWSVSQVKKWGVSRTTHDGDAAIRIEGSTFGEVVSYRDPINGRFSAPTGYSLERMEFFGKPLSRKAAEHLSEQIIRIVVAVQTEERAAVEAAIGKLVAAGAVVTPCPSGHGFRVEYKGGRYTIWGRVGGTNKMSGMAQSDGQWVETTAEELLAEA